MVRKLPNKSRWKYLTNITQTPTSQKQAMAGIVEASSINNMKKTRNQSLRIELDPTDHNQILQNNPILCKWCGKTLSANGVAKPYIHVGSAPQEGLRALNAARHCAKVCLSSKEVNEVEQENDQDHIQLSSLEEVNFMTDDLLSGDSLHPN